MMMNNTQYDAVGRSPEKWGCPGNTTEGTFQYQPV